MEQQHKVAAIILNFNSWQDTYICIESVKKQSLIPYIIVVDNCSTDNSFKELQKLYEKEQDNRKFTIDIIKAPNNGGYSTGNNYGIHYAENKYDIDTIVILNPDVILTEKDFLSNLLEKLFANKRVAIIGGMTNMPNKKFDRNRAAWSIPNGWELSKTHSLFSDISNVPAIWKSLSNNSELKQVDCVVGCMFMAKLSYFRQMGYFDEHVFLYNEENLLGIACKQCGYIETVSSADSYIHNHKSKKLRKQSFIKHMKATDNDYESKAYLCKKYYSKKWLVLLFIIHVLNKFCLLCGYLKTCFKFR